MSDSKLSAKFSDGNSYQDIRVHHSCYNLNTFPKLDTKSQSSKNRNLNLGQRFLSISALFCSDMGKILDHYVEHLCEISLNETNGLRELIFKEIVYKG